MALLVKKPLSVFDKALTISWRDALRTLGKSIPHFVCGKTPELAADLVELASTLGFVHEPGDIAWLLIRRSLSRALVDLIRDHRELFGVEPPDAQAVVESEAGFDFDSEVLEIDEQFFRDPGSLDLLGRLRQPLANWLRIYGLSETAARAIAERLRPYFVLALHDEWARTPSDYTKLRESINTPFTRAQDLERAWLRYEAHLWHIVNEPMFTEPFGLKAVYVPLRAFWERPATNHTSSRNSEEIDGRGIERATRVVVSLTRALDEWLALNRKDDAIRVISGGPGSGKSSFTRMYAAETMTKGQVRVLYVPLHLFDPKGDLISAVGDYVRTSRVLAGNPLEVSPADKPRRLLIVFDGLDELAMQGKLAAETAQQFVREVDRTVDKLNQMTAWLSVLLSGRELVVQANETEFRRPGQVLNLLPYHVDANSVGAEPHTLGATPRWRWEDPSKLLDRDQRSEWWRKYREATGIEPESIPNEFLVRELGDITRQPLLLYLVSLSFARNKLILGPETNLNDVYADLIDAVWSRAYEGRRFRGIQELTKDQFIRVLEEIGLAAWHDERRTTTTKAIREHFESASLTKILDTFQLGAEAGVTRLLAAFYFRQHGERDGEKTFEFTHKSFGEYLAACRIVRTLAVLDRAMKDHEDDPDRGKDVVDALAAWSDVCGPAPLDNYYVLFITRELRRRKPEDVAKWQQRIAAMMTTAIKTGTPMERMKPRPSTFHEELRRARNAEEALFACAAAAGDVTHHTTAVSWPNTVAAGAWIKRLQGQRVNAHNAVVTESLRWLNLEKCHLDMVDLYGGKLDGANLKEAQCRGTCFEQASLVGANLWHADLYIASFQGADLRRANLEGARVGSKYRRSNFDHANLDGAITKGLRDDSGLIEDPNSDRLSLAIQGRAVPGVTAKPSDSKAQKKRKSLR